MRKSGMPADGTPGREAIRRVRAASRQASGSSAACRRESGCRWCAATRSTAGRPGLSRRCAPAGAPSRGNRSDWRWTRDNLRRFIWQGRCQFGRWRQGSPKAAEIRANADDRGSRVNGASRYGGTADWPDRRFVSGSCQFCNRRRHRRAPRRLHRVARKCAEICTTSSNACARLPRGEVHKVCPEADRMNDHYRTGSACRRGQHLGRGGQK